MRRIATALLYRINESIESTPSGSQKIALARSLIAAAQLSILIFTQWEALFVPVGSGSFGPSCDGLGKVSLYCLLYDAAGIKLPTLILILGLIFILSGYFPRFAGLLHFWITISISSAINLPDGGESVAQIVVMLLALISLSDLRVNHWQQDAVKYNKIVPLSWAASHLVRFQLIWVYINAAVSKTSVPEWKEGSAVYYIALDPMFGASGPVAPIIDWAVEQPMLSLSMTWGAIVIEMAIAALLVGTASRRPIGFWLAVLLHGSFILVIGLWSFAFIMVGAVLVATGPTVRLKDLFRISLERQKLSNKQVEYLRS